VYEELDAIGADKAEAKARRILAVSGWALGCTSVGIDGYDNI